MEGTTGLDCNHNCFVLVDDGKPKFNETGKRLFGGEIKFRARLESAISKLNFDAAPSPESTSEAVPAQPAPAPRTLSASSVQLGHSPSISGNKTPIVTIVIQGGIGTVR